MNKILQICVLFLMLSFLSCSVNKKLVSSQRNTESIPTSGQVKLDTVANDHRNSTAVVYFRGSGTEPFWDLELSTNKIKLKTITDSVSTPYVKPIQAIDGNVKRYKIKAASGQFDIKIIPLQCTNAMSGKVFPYKVTVEYKKNTEQSLQEVEGCGAYITDYRLYDIWVLEKLNGKNVEINSFNTTLPLLEINSATNTFTGFTGCNNMNGKLFYEKELLQFTDIVTTEKMCKPNNQESSFINALTNATAYKTENNRLWLSNLKEELLVFKKID